VLDEPTGIDLLEALADFLREEAVPHLQGSPRFRALVAANVAAVVAREIERGDAIEEAELKSLCALLGAAPDSPQGESRRQWVERLRRELVARIEAGDADAEPWKTRIRDHLRRVVADKLTIDNPKLLLRPSAKER